MRYRQEVFNVLLAQLLQERGVLSAPETILKYDPSRSRRMPDVLVDFNGLRTVIEGEIESTADAPGRALSSAQRRVEEGIAHIGVALVYPAHLQGSAFARLKAELTACQFQVAVVTEAVSSGSGFVSGNLDDLENALRHAFDQLVQEDVVAEAVALLDAGIERFAGVIMTKKGIAERVADILGVADLAPEESGGEDQAE